MTKKQFSLRVHITALFSSLAVIVGAAIFFISYHHSEQLLSTSAHRISNENRLKLKSGFEQLAMPAFTTLDYLAMSPVLGLNSAPFEDKRWLATIQQLFAINTGMQVFFYASEQGAMSIFRPLLDKASQQRFSAPSSATLYLQYRQVDGLNAHYYFDDALNVIEHHQADDNDYDPRQRSWYVAAQQDDNIHMSSAYQLKDVNEIGITLSRLSYDGMQVVGTDFTLNSMSEQIARIDQGADAQLLLINHDKQVLGKYHSEIDINAEPQLLEQQLKQSVFGPIFRQEMSLDNGTSYDFELQGENWNITNSAIVLPNGDKVYLLAATPYSSLIANLLQIRDQQTNSAMVMLLICFILAWLVASRLSQPINRLINLTERITHFQFQRISYPRSTVKEVSDLSAAIMLMEHTLHDMVMFFKEAASTNNFHSLAKLVVARSYELVGAETIIVYSKDLALEHLEVAASRAVIPFKINLDQLFDDMPHLREQLRAEQLVHLKKSDLTGTEYEPYFHCSDMYFFPLISREKRLIGVISFGYDKPISEEIRNKHAFLTEVLSLTAIAKDNIDQIKQQKDMLNAFIELIASAIDIKSPYTSGHCQRVPELCEMLTEAAVSDRGHFADFSLTEQQREAVHLAAWLHDCGKITTPEYVVDKATKLETIYDRIHEVRMRFELLKSQQHTFYWQQRFAGGDAEQLQLQLDQELQQLDEDFAFVAECNLGSEFMDEDKQQRLQQIAQRQWQRTLDDTLGVSELERMRAGNRRPLLPVMEPLLADKATHKIAWLSDPTDTWKENYVLKPSENKYNRGELYNLQVQRGTLTAEERFIINDHIIQTQIMLKSLPYPEHLKQVPEIAGNHHERMDGQGYPRGLTGDQMGIAEKAMAIADIFEALTARDRPYKEPKTIDESLRIMTNMMKNGHIDPQLYLLFLQQRLDQKYAAKFLVAEQNIAFDRQTYIKQVEEYIAQIAV